MVICPFCGWQGGYAARYRMGHSGCSRFCAAALVTQPHSQDVTRAQIQHPHIQQKEPPTNPTARPGAFSSLDESRRVVSDNSVASVLENQNIHTKITLCQDWYGTSKFLKSWGVMFKGSILVYHLVISYMDIENHHIKPRKSSNQMFDFPCVTDYQRVNMLNW